MEKITEYVRIFRFLKGRWVSEEELDKFQELKQDLRDAKSKVGNLCNQLREEESIRRSIQDVLNRQIEKLKEEVAFWSNQCIAKDSEVKGK